MIIPRLVENLLTIRKRLGTNLRFSRAVVRDIVYTRRMCAMNHGFEFVRRAPRQGGGGDVEIMVARLGLGHARWWDAEVQPIIDKIPNRADCGWQWWPKIWALAQLTRTVGQRPAGYAIGVPLRETNQFVPCALLQLAESYPALDVAGTQSVFVWYVSVAPTMAILPHLGSANIPKRLGAIALDVSMCISQRHGYEGRIGLHASSGGGQQLADWYTEQGMLSLPPTTSLPGSRAIIGNDGRYYYHTPATARAAMTMLDALR